MEGEFTIGFQLKELSDGQQRQFIEDLKEALHNGKQYDMAEHYTMPPYYLSKK